MMTIEVIEPKKKPEVRQLMRSLISNQSSLGVVRFFAMHPRGRFSRLAVIHAMDDSESRREIEKAIDDLIETGVLKAGTEKGVCCYRLTADEPVRGIVLKTSEMDWRQWQLVFERV
jgi:hypothetical protein